MRSACEWLVHPEAPGILKSIAIIDKGGGVLPKLFSKKDLSHPQYSGL